MKKKPEDPEDGVVIAFQRGKRDAEAKRRMAVPYADREKQEAYERGYKWARLHRQSATA